MPCTLHLAQTPVGKLWGDPSPDPPVLLTVLASEVYPWVLCRDQQSSLTQHIDNMNVDELDMDLQSRIAEQIRQQNIQQNMESAWEHSPEVFSDVYMLYVSMQVAATIFMLYVLRKFSIEL